MVLSRPVWGGGRSGRRPRARRRSGLRSVLTVGGLVMTVVAGQAATGPSASAASYDLKAGESLSGVARRFGVTVAQLADANDIADVNRVQAGTRLVLPKGAAKSDATGDRRRSAPATLPLPLRGDPERLALLPRFDAEARRYGVPPELLKAVAWQESGWQNDRVSSAGALGIGQLMPDTIRFLNERLLPKKLDPDRPHHNIRMSSRLLAYLLDRTGGDVDTAVASYYQGLASVRRNGPTPETRSYVAKVLALRSRF
jgi:soluble lytic murein transglycosylase-like protein